MSRITLPGRKPLLLPGTSKRALRRPNGAGLVMPQLSGEPLSGNEIDYDELDILRQWREYSPTSPNEVRYFCYELEQLDPGAKDPERYFKVVRLMRLTRVPRYLRQQSTTEEFRDILSSLREKQILFLNIIAKSPKLPLVFAYGVQGVGDSLQEAMDKADEAYAALTVSLDGSYQQLEYKPLTVTEGELLARYQNEWRNIAMARGRPLPEEAGLGASAILDGNRTDVQQVNDAISSFIRGMGDKSFMMSLVTVPLTPEDMSHAWRNISVKLSAVRSDQQGSRSVGASFAIPLGLGASLSDGSGTTHGLTGTTGSGASDGLSASQTEGMSVSHADTTSLSETQGVSVSETQGVSASETTGVSVSESMGVNASENVGASVSASEGTSESMSAGIADSASQSITDGISESTAVGESVSQGQSFSATQGTTDSLSVSETAGITNTHSMSETASVTQGQSLGVSNSAGANWSQSVGQGLSATQTMADSWNQSFAESLNQTWGISESHTDAFNRGSSQGGNANIGGGIEALGLNASLGETWSDNFGANFGSGFGSNLSQTGGATSTSGISSSMSNALSNSINISETAGGSMGQSVTGTNSITEGQSLSAGQSLGYSQSQGVTQGTSMSSSATQGANYSQGASLSHGLSSSQTVGQSLGQTLSQGVGASTSSGASLGSSQGASQGVSQSATQGASYSATQGVSQSATQGASHSVSQGASATDTVGANASATQGASTGTSSQQALSDAWMVAMSRQAAQTGSFGIMPGMNASISKATFDEGKRALGDILEAQMRRYQDGVEGGGLLYQLFLTTEDRDTLAGASALLRSAFWGPGDSQKGRLVQPFHTMIIEEEDERERLLTHAAALTHYRKREPVMDLIEPHLYSSFVTPGEASVFSAPPTSEAIGLMAQVDSMPVLAMPADRASRDMHLGHVVNGERGRVSDARFGVDLNELTHILIQGTTGMGKTTTMMRLLEQAATLEREIIMPPTLENPAVQVQHAKAGVLCFDWMENMRDLANVVSPDRFQLFSVSQPELGAFRWNPLEIPHPNMPAHQWLGTQADQLAASFGLGEMGRSLLAEYIDQLYMANRLQPFVLRPAKVDEETGAILRREIVLDPVDRRTLPAGAIQVDEMGEEVANVYTCSELSRLVSLTHIASMVVSLVEELATPEGARAQGTAMRDRVQSLWRRIQYYAPGGPLADMVACDPDLNTRECLGVRDIIDPDKGLVTVIETDGLEQGSRRVILGSVMLAIYRYGLHVGKGAFDHGGKGPGTFLVMEEAHELFGTEDEGEDRDSVSMRVNLYESMFRRARASGLRLVAMTQNCGAIPAAITSQTTTVIVHRTYDQNDRARVCDLFSWDQSMVGQIRERRYLGEMPKGYAIVRLDAQHSFLESAPVQILVDPPVIPSVSGQELAALAQTRTRRLGITA